MKFNVKEQTRLIKEYNDYRVQNTILNAKDIILYDSQEIFDNTDPKLMTPYEKPDMYVEFDDKVIGIEVFEFSSYKNTKKGDTAIYKSKLADNSNKIEFMSTGKKYFTTHIDTTSSLEYYEANFKTIFSRHYQEIDNYKSNLQFKNKKTEMYFLIRDTTIGGNVIFYDDKPTFFNPLMSKEVLNIISNSPNVDGFIFQCSTVYNQNVFFYLKNNRENIQKTYDENKKYFGIELEKNDFTRINSF